MQHYQFIELKYPLVIAEHLKRTAVIYVRQSTEENAGSRALCQSQVEVARAYGWSEHLIEVIDDDLGKGGFSTDHQFGWLRMLAEIANNAAGIVLATSVSRLTRQASAYEQLLSLAADHGTLLCIGNEIIDPSDRLWRDNQ
jgi:DNA invertase Pin-like site-specific DNA recombinase